MGISKRGNQHLRTSARPRRPRRCANGAKQDRSQQSMGQPASGAARLQPSHGGGRQQECTDHLGRASNGRTVPRCFLKACPEFARRRRNETAQVGPARKEPDFYRGLRGLPAVEACASGFPIWAPRSHRVTPDRCLQRAKQISSKSTCNGRAVHRDSSSAPRSRRPDRPARCSCLATSELRSAVAWRRSAPAQTPSWPSPAPPFQVDHLNQPGPNRAGQVIMIESSQKGQLFALLNPSPGQLGLWRYDAKRRNSKRDLE